MRARRGARIAIHGNSGDAVRVVESRGYPTVEKAAHGTATAQRLKRQMDKQRTARIDNELGYVHIPAVIAESESEGSYTAEMEYVYYLDAMSFFDTASISDVDAVSKMLVGLVDSEIEVSPVEDVPSSTFLGKLELVEHALEEQGSACMYQAQIHRLRYRFQSSDSLRIPVGRCHGDLTMSNLLISPDVDALALIDFLDSFVESPLVDLAKLRQDTMFNWTLLMADDPVDHLRIRQIMAYMDRCLDERYRTHAWYSEHIETMSALNLLRIAPYATSAAVHDFLVSSLDQLRM